MFQFIATFMAPLFVPPTSFLVSIPLLLESLIALILSTIYLGLTKDGALVFIVVSVRLSSVCAKC